MNRVNKKGNIHKSLTITVSEEDWEMVVAYAERCKISVAKVISWFIEDGIRERDQRRP